MTVSLRSEVSSKKKVVNTTISWFSTLGGPEMPKSQVQTNNVLITRKQ